VDNETWTKEFPAAITVCDAEGRIVSLNDRAAATFAADGGLGLIGRSVLDCHPEPARTKLKELLETGRVNVYTVRKSGRRKIVLQAPWSESGKPAGIVELSFEIPEVIPHFDRDAR
jgi:PAS domain-containing protein